MTPLTGPDAYLTADTENGGIGDGLVQLLEFAFGTDPDANDNSALVVGSGTFTPGTQTTFLEYSPTRPSQMAPRASQGPYPDPP